MYATMGLYSASARVFVDIKRSNSTSRAMAVGLNWPTVLMLQLLLVLLSVWSTSGTHDRCYCHLPVQHAAVFNYVHNLFINYVALATLKE